MCKETRHNCTTTTPQKFPPKIPHENLFLGKDLIILERGEIYTFLNTQNIYIYIYITAFLRKSTQK